MPYIGKEPARVPVTADDIPNDSITAAKIVDGAITVADIGTNAVDTAELVDDAVTADKLANSINTAIAANTAKTTNATHTGDVTGATALTIAADAVTGAKIADNAIDSEHYVDDSIDAAHLANSINTDIATGVTANTTANAALPKAGGTMTGTLTVDGGGTISAVSTTDLKINATDDLFLSAVDNIYIQPQGNDNGITLIGNGAVTLHHDSNPKLATTSTGIDVTGASYSSGNIGLNVDNYLGFSDDSFARFVVNDTEILRATAAGNVGIGTSPNHPLDVSFAGHNGIRAISTSGDSRLFLTSGSTGNTSTIAFGDSGETYQGVIKYDHSDDSMRFDANASERMRIDSNGDVGIGTTAPGHKLSIRTPSAGGGRMHLGYNGTSASTETGRISTNSYDVDNEAYSLAEMSFVTSSANGYTGEIQFRTNSVNSTNTRADIRMTIDSNGNLGVGTANPQARIDAGGGYLANEQGRTDHVANTMPSPYYHFQGSTTNAYITTGSGGIGNLGSNSTFSCWVRRDTLAAGYIWDSRSSGDNGTGYFYFDPNSAVLTVSSGTIYINGVVSSSGVAEGEWAHVTVTGATINNPSESYIGRRNSDAYRLEGAIKDFRVYNTTLTADEVKELYSGGSVPFKYKAASQTLLLDDDCADDDTGDWATDASSSLVFDTDHYELVNSGAGHGANERFTTIAGKQYRLSIDLKDGTASGVAIQLILRDDSGAGPIWNNELKTTTASWVTHTITAIAGDTDGEFYIYPNTSLSGSNIEFKNVKITQIGAVAEYDGSSATSSTWYDKSGNDLDGTVSGATLENKVTALEVTDDMSIGIALDSEWHTDRANLQIGTGGLSQHNSYPHGLDLIANGILKTSGEKQLNTSYPSNKLQLWDGTFLFKTEAAGNATISWANPVTIDSDGIKFNADTAAANALDDYEEGTWTPAMTGYGGTINVQTGTYVIIGGMCYFNIQLGFNGSDVSTVNITLPVTSKNLGTQTGGGYMTYNDYVSGASSLEQMMPYVGSNSSTLSVFINNNQFQTYNGFGAANGQCYYYFSGQYQV